MSYRFRFRRLVAFIALESWASHAASCPIHLITLSRAACDYSSPNYHSQQLIAPGSALDYQGCRTQQIIRYVELEDRY